jgi:hypothetical protein
MKSRFLYLTLAMTMAVSSVHAEDPRTVAVPKAPVVPVFNVIASNGSGPADLDIFIMRRVGDVLSFKSCPARTQDGKATPASTIRTLRFDPMKPLDDAAFSADLYAKIFADPSCHSIGAAAYGRAHDLRYTDDGKEVDPGHFYEYYGTHLAAIVGSSLLAVTKGFRFYSGYYYFKQKHNGLSFRGALASAELNKTPLVIAAIGVMVAAGAATNLYIGGKDQDNLMVYQNLLSNSYEKKGGLSVIDTPISEFESSFKVGLDAAVEQHALLML